MSSPRVIVPYTRLHPTVREVLSRRTDVEFIPLAGDEAYWQLLSRLWQARHSVVINEHDVVPWPQAIEELLACPKPWCAYSYERQITPEKDGTGDYFGFGCVKFSTELMEQFPTIWEQMADRHWSKLDTQFEWLTWQGGARPHTHRPSVTHLH